MDIVPYELLRYKVLVLEKNSNGRSEHVSSKKIRGDQPISIAQKPSIWVDPKTYESRRLGYMIMS